MTASSWMIDRLQLETRAHHTAADADLDVLFAQDVSSTDYRLYLVRMYGFEAPLESALSMTPTLELMLDLRQRSRAGLIAQDLMQLGMRAYDVAELPQSLAIPPFPSAADALGWTYVVERATLAHSVIRAHLQTRLPHEMQIASAYLHAYAGVVGRRWRAFGATLDEIARHPAIADRIVAAAQDGFRCQRRWNSHEHLGTGTRAVG